jgi:hypothetical protein
VAVDGDEDNFLKQKLADSYLYVQICRRKTKDMRKEFAKIFTMICIMSIGTHSADAQIGEPSKGSIATMKEEEFTYESDGVKLKGFVAYVPNEKNKLPVVLVVPEWWGYNSYVKMRARKLAELGYIAMVVDMYGDGKEATSVDEAQKFSG